MDKLLPKKNKLKKYYKYGIIILISVLFLFVLRFCVKEGLKSASVRSKDLVTAVVEKKNLVASFSVSGKVIPRLNYQVEAPVGGKIEKICKKIGDTVKKDDVLVILTNDDLQLQLINSETDVTDQINNLSIAKIQRNQSHLSQKRTLATLKQQLSKKQRDLKNMKELCDKKYVSEEEYKTNSEEYEVLLDNYNLTIEEAQVDSLMREQQIVQMEQSLTQVKKNLQQMRNKVKDLVVRAPIEGQITDFELTSGQILSMGSKIAVIENNNEYYIQSNINQYYLNRLKLGAIALITDFDPPLEIEIENIHPKLEGDNVIVDFKGNLLNSTKSGQQVNIDLLTAKINNALAIPLGQYLTDNDYRWVFVVDKSGKKAGRRQIETGSRNTSEIEIIKGLTEGESVITNSNPDWKNKEIINIK